jgi:hypothetical protein
MAQRRKRRGTREVPSFNRGGHAKRPKQHNAATYRSGLEGKISHYLDENGVAYRYEHIKVRYVVPARSASYTPDWWITGNGIIIEGKGIFEVDDRKKHLLIKHQHPDLDIRFVFTRSASRLYKASPTTYAMWCETHHFLYADKLPPLDWLHEPPCERRIAAIARAIEEPNLEKWALFKLPRS